MIKQLNHVSVIVSDTERSLRFYSDILGLELDPARPELGYPGAWLRVGQQQIHLLQLPNPDDVSNRPAHGGRDRHMAFDVDELAEIIAQLDASGIDYSMSVSGRRALFCRDPDGNAVELIENA